MKRLLAAAIAVLVSLPALAVPDVNELDDIARQAMASTSAQGLAVAVIEDGDMRFWTPAPVSGR